MGILGKKRGRPKKNHEKITKERIWCSRCHDVSVMSSSNVEDLICGDCFAIEMLYEDEIIPPKKKNVGYPRGWHRRKLFVDDSGKTYSFGKEIPSVRKRKSTRNSSKVL